ncbi:MAG: 6-carboxytetrahydropterin synthase QueD [Candidatus Margulisiibacteriota bacterium]|jgi:6-pyruvoyltetrahydropterin/6-carboxytetrahydropterin synthase
MFEISVEGSFAAAHYLRHYKGKCENLHGHNYKVLAAISGEILDVAGLSIDFGLAKKWLGEILEPLDHCSLNDLEFFKEINPSAENIAKHIYNEYKKRLPRTAKLAKITVWETEKNSVSYWE